MEDLRKYPNFLGILLVVVTFFSLFIGHSWSEPSSISKTNSNALCSNITNCPSCERIGQLSSNVLMILQGTNQSGEVPFVNNMKKAIQIIKKYPGVVSTDEDDLHSTLFYFCCYHLVEYKVISDIFANYSWSPFEMKFDHAVCNSGGDSNSTYLSIIVTLEKSSEQKMQHLVKHMEHILEQEGIRIHVPRKHQEPFHSTLAVVDSSYPLDKVLKEINTQIPVFSPIPVTISCFTSVIPPVTYCSNNA